MEGTLSIPDDAKVFIMREVDTGSSKKLSSRGWYGSSRFL
jgi:hypothetical protein